MTDRTAACACGDLRITVRGGPVKVSSCCCIACQRRTGSFVGVTAFYPQDRVAEVQGASSVFRRIGGSGKPLDFHFCPRCGSTVFWYPQARPGTVAVAGGAFGDPAFPGPERIIWTENRNPWVCVPEGTAEYPRAP